MNKNNTKKALSDIEQNILLFYNEMKWILNSKRGKNFQFMMLNETLEAVLYRSSQTRKKHEADEEMPKSPLDI